MVETILDGQQVLALLIRSSEEKLNGIEFYTDPSFDFQLAKMCHPAGYKIAAHKHLPRTRTIESTCEVLIIKRGRLHVEFFSAENNYVSSRILHSDDCLLLMSGGHGFEVLDDVEFLEVKQGPFTASLDKIRLSLNE